MRFQIFFIYLCSKNKVMTNKVINRIIKAMQSECNSDASNEKSIFNVLLSICNEQPFDVQIKIEDVLSSVTKEIFCKYQTKSLCERNSQRDEVMTLTIDKISEAKFEKNIETHVKNAVRAVWKTINKRAEEENKKVHFWESECVDYSRRFILK